MGVKRRRDKYQCAVTEWSKVENRFVATCLQAEPLGYKALLILWCLMFLFTFVCFCCFFSPKTVGMMNAVLALGSSFCCFPQQLDNGESEKKSKACIKDYVHFHLDHFVSNSS